MQTALNGMQRAPNAWPKTWTFLKNSMILYAVPWDHIGLTMCQTRQRRRLQAIKHGWEHLKDCYKPAVRKFVSPHFCESNSTNTVEPYCTPAVAYFVTKIAPASALGRKITSLPGRQCKHVTTDIRFENSGILQIRGDLSGINVSQGLECGRRSFICKKLTLQV